MGWFSQDLRKPVFPNFQKQFLSSLSSIAEKSVVNYWNLEIWAPSCTSENICLFCILWNPLHSPITLKASHVLAKALGFINTIKQTASKFLHRTLEGWEIERRKENISRQSNSKSSSPGNERAGKMKRSVSSTIPLI